MPKYIMTERYDHLTNGNIPHKVSCPVKQAPQSPRGLPSHSGRVCNHWAYLYSMSFKRTSAKTYPIKAKNNP